MNAGLNKVIPLARKVVIIGICLAVGWSLNDAYRWAWFTMRKAEACERTHCLQGEDLADQMVKNRLPALK